MKTLLRALRYMAPYWAWQAMALLCALCVTATSFVWPYISKIMVDKVFIPSAGTASQRLHALNTVCLMMLGIALAGSILGPVRAYLFARVSEKTAADLRRDLFSHLHLLPMTFFNSRKTGGIMSVVQSDVEALQGLYSSTLVDLLTNLLTVLFAIGLMLSQNVTLALMSMPVPIVFAFAITLFGKRLHRAGTKVREETGAVQEVLQESIAGAREVKSFTMGRAEVKRYMDRVWRLVNARIHIAVLGASNGSVANLVAIGGITFIMLTGSRMAIAGKMTPGNVILFINVLEMLFGPASAFVNLFTQVASVLGAADRIFAMIDEAPEMDAVHGVVPTHVEGLVEYNDVRFRYNAEGVDALSRINLTVQPGEVTALVGPSGSGKTTLVSLLPRMYEATEGSIRIDKKDIRDYPLADLRGMIAVVPQEPFLFGTTVLENIGFGRADATRGEMEAAARAANAHEFIVALPQGYDTQIGERGSRLSVGQKQRIAIARAILRNPRILILDEATSAQDSESELLVQEAMRNLTQGRTSFVIAHRLSTVQRADRIVVLDGGRIVETGTHAALLEMNGLYSRLHAIQFSNMAEA